MTPELSLPDPTFSYRFGPESGPRDRSTQVTTPQRRKGRAFVKRLATTISILTAMPAVGQTDQMAEIGALVREAKAEYQVFMTCSALNPIIHQSTIDTWKQLMDLSEPTLVDLGYNPLQIAQFRLETSYAAIMPTEDISYAEAIEFCNEHPDWYDEFYTFEFIILSERLHEFRE